ncbi:MAG: hypothetical protein ACFCU4_03060 [Puniceicoccaceae bacterium]
MKNQLQKLPLKSKMTTAILLFHAAVGGQLWAQEGDFEFELIPPIDLVEVPDAADRTLSMGDGPELVEEENGVESPELIEAQGTLPETGRSSEPETGAIQKHSPAEGGSKLERVEMSSKEVPVSIPQPLVPDQPAPQTGIGEVEDGEEAIPTSAQGSAAEVLSENVRFFQDRTGSRLVVAYASSRPDSPARTLSLRILENRVYDPQTFSFVPQDIAVLSGQGLSVGGISFFVDDAVSRQAMIDLLLRFDEDAKRFQESSSELAGQQEDWMSDGLSMLNGKVDYGTITLSGAGVPSAVSFNWDLRSARTWLSIDGIYNIDASLATPVRQLIERVEQFRDLRDEYVAQLEGSKERVAEMVGLSR